MYNKTATKSEPKKAERYVRYTANIENLTESIYDIHCNTLYVDWLIESFPGTFLLFLENDDAHHGTDANSEDEKDDNH